MKAPHKLEAIPFGPQYAQFLEIRKVSLGEKNVCVQKGGITESQCQVNH